MNTTESAAADLSPRLQRLSRNFLGAILLTSLVLPLARAQSGVAENIIAPEDTAACQACHGDKTTPDTPFADAKALAASPHKDLKCQDCHYSINAYPHTKEMTAAKADCALCHDAESQAFAKGVHAGTDKFEGDHPSCLACHAPKDPHAVMATSEWTRKDKALLCSECHANADRMNRYGVDVDAVGSYNRSFHGKALLRFGMTDAAACTDCHGSHGVLASTNPTAPTHRNNAAKTCGQTGCHEGAKVNFAMSGANHLDLKIDKSAVLRYELLFFKVFVFGTLAFLMTGVALDLRRKVFGPHPPRSGRLVAALTGISFLFIAATILLATLHKPGPLYCFITAAVLLIIAFAVYFAKRGSPAETGEERHFERLTLQYRLQHGIMAVAFTVLAVTGLPQRFYEAAWLAKVYIVFGGLGGARIAHRAAAVALILVWLWHLAYIIGRWKRSGWSMKVLTMLPNLTDLRHFAETSKYYLGLTKTEPKYGRFSFREKMDYLAEYWGMPVMVLSGIVLWAPIFWGNRLPEVALSFAYIAHSYEATLAFLSIVTWHMYGAHLNPDSFPMNPVWLTGKLSREQMAREHAAELEEMERKVA